VTLADANVMIYAFRSDTARHVVCRRWLDGIVTADAQFGMSPLALSAVIRITTNPRIFREPSSTDEVLAYCDNLLDQPNCEVVHPGDRHWAIFSGLCRSFNVRGPLVTDAWFAALAIEHGCTWITCDRDYARFPELDWREPAA
jgi:toxin-antitoxin system PIN domain toxin